MHILSDSHQHLLLYLLLVADHFIVIIIVPTLLLSYLLSSFSSYFPSLFVHIIVVILILFLSYRATKKWSCQGKDLRSAMITRDHTTHQDTHPTSYLQLAAVFSSAPDSPAVTLLNQLLNRIEELLSFTSLFLTQNRKFYVTCIHNVDSLCRDSNSDLQNISTIKLVWCIMAPD